MWLKQEDLLGLVVGLALGGAGLYLFLPRIEAALAPVPPKTFAAQPAVPSAGQSAMPQAARVLAPAPMIAQRFDPPAPDVVVPDPAPLPNVEYPELAPEHPEAPLPVVVEPSHPPKATGTAGTGFFVADDGSLLTAAHVVTDCRRMTIVSRFVKLTAADTVAFDAKLDLALLRGRHVRPPAILSLGRPASHHLVVLGYPATAGMMIPEETWATLENDKFPASVAALADPRQMIWIEASAVTHGYSGGPIFDPDSGSVVGLVRATITDKRLGLIHGMPTTGIAVGPGEGRLSLFLRREAPYLDPVQAEDTGNAAIEDARRATVHVLCWH